MAHWEAPVPYETVQRWEEQADIFFGQTNYREIIAPNLTEATIFSPRLEAWREAHDTDTEIIRYVSDAFNAYRAQRAPQDFGSLSERQPVSIDLQRRERNHMLIYRQPIQSWVARILVKDTVLDGSLQIGDRHMSFPGERLIGVQTSLVQPGCERGLSQLDNGPLSARYHTGVMAVSGEIESPASRKFWGDLPHETYRGHDFFGKLLGKGPKNDPISTIFDRIMGFSSELKTHSS